MAMARALPKSVRAELVEARWPAGRLRPSTGSGRTGFGILIALLLAPAATAQTTEQKLDALEARIERLEDLIQIERVQRTYGYFVDKGQWTQLSELFTDDATL